ncbi:hypothetical protein EJB05_22787 [Eragrostis curvula]|uniref:EGF-like domain-containing protein n=1 Tax=Eragrostis curvula TaxID=38414 RepID=A0A5J9V5C6_9POAL|nr:hypothetical protein EJB05_22787 [Eragrostis curvula]
MARRTTRRFFLRTLLILLVLIACAPAPAAAEDDVGAAGEESVCDGADCGRGSCTVRSGWIPGTVSYKCECDPGWTRAIRSIAFSPCNVPKCSFNSSCLDLSLLLPRGIPFSDPCVAVNCGAGTCKKDEGFHYHCECEPGNVNMLNNTKYPCVDANCLMGMHCPALNDPAPPPSSRPPPSASTSPAPPGSLSLESLVQQMVVVSLAMLAQVM